MPLASDTPVYDVADLQPKGSAEELKLWWNPVGSAYYPYRVKMEQRTPVDGLDFLSFRLARDESLGVFKVELTQQTAYVWPYLPSTVQNATDQLRYGFLLLSEDWELEVQEKLTADEKNVKVHELREGGGKWPLSGEVGIQAVMALTRNVLQSASDKNALDPKLHNLLQTLDSLTR